MASREKWERQPGERFDDYERRRREQRKRDERRFNIIVGIWLVLVVIGVIILVIWLRSIMPCGWFALKDAPVRCFNGVLR